MTFLCKGLKMQTADEQAQSVQPADENTKAPVAKKAEQAKVAEPKKHDGKSRRQHGKGHGRSPENKPAPVQAPQAEQAAE